MSRALPCGISNLEAGRLPNQVEKNVAAELYGNWKRCKGMSDFDIGVR